MLVGKRYTWRRLPRTRGTILNILDRRIISDRKWEEIRSIARGDSRRVKVCSLSIPSIGENREETCVRNRAHKKRRTRERGKRREEERERENPKWPECVRARAVVGTWHTRVPVSLGLARTHGRRLYATLLTRVFIHTALRTTTTHGRTTRTRMKIQEDRILMVTLWDIHSTGDLAVFSTPFLLPQYRDRNKARTN